MSLTTLLGVVGALTGLFRPTGWARVHLVRPLNASVAGRAAVGLVACLLLGTVALVAAVVELRNQVAAATEELGGLKEALDPIKRSHDVERVRRIRAHLTPAAIEWARRHPFGSSWRASSSEPFLDLRERLLDPEHTLLNRELELKRIELFDVVEAFGHEIAINSGPASGNFEIRNVVDWGSVEPSMAERLQQERSTTLDRASEEVALAYDRFVEAVRQTLPEALSADHE